MIAPRIALITAAPSPLLVTARPATYTLTRTVRQENGTFCINGVQNPMGDDVQIGLGAESVCHLSHVELSTGANLIRELNRDFKTDTWSLNAIIGIRYHAGR